MPAGEIDAAFARTTDLYRRKAKIPGFRPGKAPLAMVEKRYGSDIRQEVLETVVPEAFDGALKQLSLVPLSQPGLSAVKLERGAPLTFEADFEIRPHVEISGYTGLTLTKQVYTVTDRDVDAALDSLRDDAANLIEVPRPAREGDVVTCDLQKIYDRLNRVKKSQFDEVKIELRADRTRPELHKGLVGMGVGEGKEIEVNYPSEEPDPDLAGNTVLYRVWVKAVAQKNIPVADDAFAQSLDREGLTTLAQLRDHLRAELQRRADRASFDELRTLARRAVVEANQFPVPESLVTEQLENMTRKLQTVDKQITEAMVRSRFEPAAVEEFRWDYAVNDIARREKISVTHAEVDAVVSSWPKESKDRPDKDRIHWALLEMKVYDFLLNAAEITETPYVAQQRIISP